jgi:uncharacterized protein YndB with AHSA1/START domain
MPHEFEIREEIELAATPEQVWQAIATGPGIDSWFMGRTEVEPREGGAVQSDLGGFVMTSTITAWEPAKRFAYQGAPNPEDGTFMAFEYLLEGREGGSTVLRYVHSGFLGDDWEAEYDALSIGDRMYLEKLAVYVRQFAGRTGFHFLIPGPQVADQEKVWTAITGVFGLTGAVSEGGKAVVSVPGLPAADGTVAFVRQPHYLGVSTDDGLYVLLHGFQNTVVAEQHDYTGATDATPAEAAWQTWLSSTFA